ncbi:MAG: PfkB family carbohydrate kinase [Haloferacaceae archaeon]
MPYDELARLLREDERRITVGALPDGSVDEYYRVRDAESYVVSRDAVAEAIRSGRDSFRLEHVMTDPGGQSVNMARQAAALGDQVTLYGHLDHPIFDLDFETVSMGAPAVVSVLLFDADDLMLVEESADIRNWTFADFRDACVHGVRDFLERDVVCCANFASTFGLPDALHAMAATTDEGNTFVLDPGPISTVREARLDALVTALGRLADSFDVVVSVNADECRRFVDVIDGVDADEFDEAGVTAGALDGIRRHTGVDAVVAHQERAAVAATPDGVLEVPNLKIIRNMTETGAGDRFSAALARGLGADWGWEASLALGNACTSYYVATGQTADREDLLTHVAVHDPV